MACGRFYFSDWLGGTRRLTPAQRGVYIDILAMIYEEKGPIRNNKMLAKAVGLPPYQFRQTVEVLIAEGKLTETDGFLSNPRAEKELAAHAERSSAAGKASSHRWKSTEKTSKKRTQNAYSERENTQQNQTPSYAIPNPITIERKKEDGLSTRARAEELEGLLREAAGWERETAPGLMVVGPILALIDAGADLEADVLPTVRAISPKARSRSSWKYFVNAIAAARDDRVAAATIVSEPINGANGHGTYREKPAANTFANGFAKVDAWIDEVRKREEGGETDFCLLP